MTLNDMAKQLEIETGANDRTVWKWLAGGDVQQPIAQALQAAREKIEAQEKAKGKRNG